MSYSLISSSYRDSSGNRILWSDNVLFSKYYNSSQESWDKTGGLSSSWYLESTLPNDSFISSLDTEKWVVSTNISNYSVSINNGLEMTVNGDSGYLYISSEGLWALSGDFSIRLGIDLSKYYDEYRSSSSFGINVSISQLYSVRVVIYRGYGYSRYYYRAFYTELADPRYLGWKPLSSNFLPDEVRFFSIKRVGNTITCYINNTIELGAISGSTWGGDAYVSIGMECNEANKFSMGAKYFFIESGQLTTTSTFSSELRGVTKSFPDESLFVVDEYGMSIVDLSDVSLWMRFVLNTNGMFTDTDCKIFVLNGRAHITSSNGLFIVDFVDDLLYKYIWDKLYQSDVGISMRNTDITIGNSQDVPMLLGNDVRDVFAKNISGKEVVSVATSSGVNLIVDRIFTLYNNEGNIPSTLVHITDENDLYWVNNNQYSGGDLSYYTGIENLLTASGIEFSRTGYYDKSTSNYPLLSTNISCIDVYYDNLDTSYKVTIGSDVGASVFLFPPEGSVYSINYSVVSESNPISDLSFSNIGTNWLLEDSSGFPVAHIKRSTSWYTGSTTGSIEIIPGNGNSHPIYTNQYSSIYQYINLTGVNRIYFDFKIIGPTKQTSATVYQPFRFEILVGSNVLIYYDEWEIDNETEGYGGFIDTSNYTGVNKFSIRAINYYNNFSGYFTSYGSSMYFSNFRSIGYNSDYEVLGGFSSEVIGINFDITSSGNKLLYFTMDGYGSIDLDTNSSDFFINGSDIPPGMSFNNTDIVDTNEYI